MVSIRYHCRAGFHKRGAKKKTTTPLAMVFLKSFPRFNIQFISLKSRTVAVRKVGKGRDKWTSWVRRVSEISAAIPERYASDFQVCLSHLVGEPSFKHQRVVDCIRQILFRPQVPFRRQDRLMPQQKLNLLQFPALRAAELRRRALHTHAPAATPR